MVILESPHLAFPTTQQRIVSSIQDGALHGAPFGAKDPQDPEGSQVRLCFIICYSLSLTY